MHVLGELSCVTLRLLHVTAAIFGQVLRQFLDGNEKLEFPIPITLVNRRCRRVYFVTPALDRTLVEHCCGVGQVAVVIQVFCPDKETDADKYEMFRFCSFRERKWSKSNSESSEVKEVYCTKNRD
ncbi:hypothetical protein CBL_03347 [Carabus blaptoides fortunei]